MSQPRPLRRTALATVVALTAAGALTACSSTPQGATTLDEDADVTLTWWTGQADQAQTILEGLAAGGQSAEVDFDARCIATGGLARLDPRAWSDSTRSRSIAYIGTEHGLFDSFAYSPLITKQSFCWQFHV